MAAPYPPPSAEIDPDFSPNDPRLARRHQAILARLEAAPEEPLLKAINTAAEQEGYYRFLRNPRVDEQLILAQHFAATAARANCLDRVAVVHDRSYFPAAVKEGKGFYGLRHPKQRGMLKQLSLVLAWGTRCPLGLIALHDFRRDIDKKERKKLLGVTKESDFWTLAIRQVRQSLHGTQRVHVIDSEGDSIELLDELVRLGESFVIRACHDRSLEEGWLFSQLEGAPVFGKRTIRLSHRGCYGSGKNRDRARQARSAEVEIRATSVVLKSWDSKITQLPVNLVAMVEPAPPEGEPPVQWYLLTDLSIDDPSDVMEIVDTYHRRWVVEDLFKVVKSGCRFNHRLHRSRHTASNALALLLPIASQILTWRFWARVKSEEPATRMFPNWAVLLLAARYPRLQRNATASEMWKCLAQFGGWRRSRSREPGWPALSRGVTRLLEQYQGIQLWEALKAGRAPPLESMSLQGFDPRQLEPPK